MHSISFQIRRKLALLVQLDDTEGSSPAPMGDSGRRRFVRKVPAKNYSDLPKLVPINWI